jgi:hypothetical protein
VNESQSKFLDGTWPISQNLPDAPLGQNRTAITKLSTLRIGSGTTAETRNGASRTMSEIDDKNRLKEHFISSQAFYRTPGGRVRKITAEEQFKPRIL